MEVKKNNNSKKDNRKAKAMNDADSSHLIHSGEDGRATESNRVEWNRHIAIF